jgi:DNA-binding transcriptional ArsR family regulator
VHSNTGEMHLFRHFRGDMPDTPPALGDPRVKDKLGRALHSLAYHGRHDLYDLAPPEVREHYRRLAISLTPDVLRAAELVLEAERRSTSRRAVGRLRQWLSAGWERLLRRRHAPEIRQRRIGFRSEIRTSPIE